MGILYLTLLFVWLEFWGLSSHRVHRLQGSNNGIPRSARLLWERRRQLYINFRGPSEFMVDFLLFEFMVDFNDFRQKNEIVCRQDHVSGFHFNPYATSEPKKRTSARKQTKKRKGLLVARRYPSICGRDAGGNPRKSVLWRGTTGNWAALRGVPVEGTRHPAQVGAIARLPS